MTVPFSGRHAQKEEEERQTLLLSIPVEVTLICGCGVQLDSIDSGREHTLGSGHSVSGKVLIKGTK